uniref:polyprenol reductase isoform X2 n=1 Tax=Epinephelus lanceolatus TaxID=310571 RepID=UPI00144872C8|nr:polyprenol reductase isoform X2 [Epinephelus lanceolatus]
MNWSSVSLSFTDVLWSFLALCFLVAFCAHKISLHLPIKHETWRLYVLFQDLIRYGKTKHSLKRDDWLRSFDVPKRWFWHFYAISVGWNSLLLAFYLNLIFQYQSYPSWLTGILDILTGVQSTNSQVPQLSTLLVQLLLCVHSLRRLLECLCVSVFSDGAIHVVQDRTPPLSAGLVSCGWSGTFYWGLADAASVHDPAGQASHWQVRNSGDAGSQDARGRLVRAGVMPTLFCRAADLRLTELSFRRLVLYLVAGCPLRALQPGTGSTALS